MEEIKRTVIADALKRTDYGTAINVRGWVRTRRGNKNVGFIALNDGSTIHNMQVVVDMSKFDDDQLKPITTGAAISVNGRLAASVGSGQSVEIQADDILIYGTADPEKYPLQKKGHTMEYLRDIAHLLKDSLGQAELHGAPGAELSLVRPEFYLDRNQAFEFKNMEA